MGSAIRGAIITILSCGTNTEKVLFPNISPISHLCFDYSKNIHRLKLVPTYKGSFMPPSSSYNVLHIPLCVSLSCVFFMSFETHTFMDAWLHAHYALHMSACVCGWMGGGTHTHPPPWVCVGIQPR